MPDDPARSESRNFTSRDFRDALGGFATGVTVITTQGEAHGYGMTATAFSSVSLDPPLVLVCIVTAAAGSDMVRQNGCFAVNILSSEQEPLSRYFSSKDRPKGRDAFRAVPHRTEVTGSPILEGVAGFVDCRLHHEHEAGDHLVFIGEVMALGADTTLEPLLFFAGKYRYLRPGD